MPARRRTPTEASRRTIEKRCDVEPEAFCLPFNPKGTRLHLPPCLSQISLWGGPLSYLGLMKALSNVYHKANAKSTEIVTLPVSRLRAADGCITKTGV